MPRFLLPACKQCAELTPPWEGGSIQPPLATILHKLSQRRIITKMGNVELSWSDLKRSKGTVCAAISEPLWPFSMMMSMRSMICSILSSNKTTHRCWTREGQECHLFRIGSYSNNKRMRSWWAVQGHSLSNLSRKVPWACQEVKTRML